MNQVCILENIEAICFDVGGTLRPSETIEIPDLAHIRAVQSLIGVNGDPYVFQQKVRQREKEYRHWCKRSLVELCEADLWSQYLLPDFPAEFIRQNAVRLNQLWRENRAKVLLPDAVSTLNTLADRGYILSIVSNTTSSTETRQILDHYGVTHLFKTIILSSLYGRRKPHPSLFLEASRAMGISPEKCAYIGDSLSRDLIGAHQAGYGAVIIINIQGYNQDDYNPDDETETDVITEMHPDARIGRLTDLLAIFPERAAPPVAASVPPPARIFDAALSTMWGVDQPIPFGETFQQARKAGFCRFELNHKVTSDLYSQFDANQYYVSTVHEPCPTPYSYEEKKLRDFNISSMDEPRRVESVDMVKRSIDLACRLGSRSVVIHPGSIIGDRSRDDRLRKLFERNLKNTGEYESLQLETIAHRTQCAAPFVDQAMISLEEIVEHARGTGILLALENRYRFYDIPVPQELELFLSHFNQDWIGFQYDTGHGFTLDALGLVDQQEWLERFGARIIGVHFHDVIGITDHQVPGQGQVDFKNIGRYIPRCAQKTLEVGPHASLEELRAGMKVLVDCGCVEEIPG